MASTIEENVSSRKAAEQALQLVIDYGVESKLSPEATAHYWECIQQQVSEIRNTIGPQRAAPSSVAKINAETRSLAKQWSTDTSDAVVIPKGKHEGESVDDVPQSYFEWLAEQEWIEVASDWQEVANWMRSEGYL